MDDIQWNVFTYVVDHVETPLTTTVSGVVSEFLSYVSTPLQVAAVLYIALTGVLILRGYHQEATHSIISRMLALAVVVWFVTTAGIYQQWVYDFFFVVLPRDLGNALTGGGAGTVGASDFDKVWIKTWGAGLEVWKTLSWDDVAEKLVIVLFWGAGIVSTGFCFAIWLVSRVILALYVAIGPLLVPLVLFPATKALFERWIGSMIACIILQISTLVLLFIVLEVEREVVGAVVALHTTDPLPMIQVSLAGIIFFAVAAYVALQLPAFASSIGGGMHFHVGAIARAGLSAVKGSGKAYSGANRMANAGAQAIGNRTQKHPSVARRLTVRPGLALAVRRSFILAFEE